MEQLLHFIETNREIILLSIAIFAFFLCILLLFTVFQLQSTKRRYRELHNKLANKNKQITSYSERDADQKVRIAKLVTLLKNERKNNHEKLMLLDQAGDKLSYQFESLASRIFEEKNSLFHKEKGEKVEAMLRPLQDQLTGFQRKIDDIQIHETRERSSLKKEIEHLRELNQQVNQEASNLSRALKADSKSQGNWGELVLERVLEKSGLRKGFEFTVQSGFRDRDNKLLKPDVIIHLPDKKDIIIDSKVSLTAWERFVNCEKPEEKKVLFQEHIKSIKKHIHSLSSKNYPEVYGINSLDFVLLFMPIDSAFTSVYEADEKLFSETFEQHIIIVTPTTLLATLKTIASMWRFEQQNRNAREIAEKAGAIYDKLRLFLDEMQKIGKQLDSCKTTYDSAMTKLVSGRGNLLSQAEKFTDLGVSVKKKMEITTEKHIRN